MRALLALLALPALAQSTQSMITGRVTDARTGAGLPAKLTLSSNPTPVTTGPGGYYSFPLLPPGLYRLRVESPGMQPAEVQNIELRLATRVEVDFELRTQADANSLEGKRLSQTSSGRVVRYFGPDMKDVRSAPVDITDLDGRPIHASVSYSMEPNALARLPLAGRDVYTLLAFLPAVTSDSASSRGLGFAANGQRPSSSNYLLDGIEMNNTLITGPALAIAPEMIQEYRVSTSTWSAEYGRTNGFLANSVTRAGGPAWHGAGYFNLKNDALNANTFAGRYGGIPRVPFKETQTGIQLGGPIVRQRLFASLGYEFYRSRSFGDEQEIRVPVLSIIGSFWENPPLLLKFRPPAPASADDFVSTIRLRPPASVNRSLGLGRLDWLSRSGSKRLFFRSVVNRFDWPDFIWSPYSGFNSTLELPALSHALAFSQVTASGWTHELRGGYSSSRTQWDRPHREIPAQFVQTKEVLPGSLAAYEFRHATRSLELSDSWMRIRGPHISKMGGGLIHRRHDGFKTIGRDGAYYYFSLPPPDESAPFFDFLDSKPRSLTLGVSRIPGQRTAEPDYNRLYRESQFTAFFEDTWRLRPRLSLNAGVRYENFRPPAKTGGGDDQVVELTAANSLRGRLDNARLVPLRPYTPLWAPQNGNLAIRLGLAWSPVRNGPVWRAGYGIFFDRPFDNLWLATADNAVGLQSSDLSSPAGPTDVRAIFNKLPAPLPSRDPLSLVDPRLQLGRSHNLFTSLQQNLTPSVDLELSALGAVGRQLITTDLINRNGSVAPNVRFNQTLPEIRWRSNQGRSSYSAFTALLRHRRRGTYLHIAYTWSHAIDNQSDALAGEFGNLEFSNSNADTSRRSSATFLEQFRPERDRGNAAFDQRHNLVFLSWWELPALRQSRVLSAITRDWRLAQTAAIRSGFPYSVIAISTGSLGQQRASLMRPYVEMRTPLPKGVRLLDPAAFYPLTETSPGNTGRNAFRGPGLWNADISVARVFVMEARRLTIRADLFNALNHVNLGAPDNLRTSSTFGVAQYGRTAVSSGLPSRIPFRETPRQIQLIAKFEF